METKTIIVVVLIVAYLILLAFDLKMYFYKRTMHKIHLKTGIDTSEIYKVVASHMIWKELIVRILKWGVIIALFFYNWIAALVCIAIGFILPILLPEQNDFKNLIKMASAVEGRKDDASIAMYEIIKVFLRSEYGMDVDRDLSPNHPQTHIHYRK